MTIEQSAAAFTMAAAMAVLFYNAGRMSARVDNLEKQLANDIAGVYRALSEMNSLIRAAFGRRRDDGEGE